MTLEGLRAWAMELLKQCQAKGLSCVAVTDHHDLIPALVLLSVAYEIKSPVWVIPGMEVTSKCGMQGILLLDPSLFGSSDTFDLDSTQVVANKVLATLGQDISAHTGNKTLKLTNWKDLTRLKDLNESKRKEIFVSPASDRVDKDFDGQGGIAFDLERSFGDKYVLLPNLEKNKHGVFGNENGRALCLKANGWFVGGVVGGGNPTDEQAIQGKNAGFGTRRLSCLRTSDQRGRDATTWFGDRLGSPDCVAWLKLSEPTTISLTQALISGDGRRVFRELPKEPGERIESLTIAGVEVFGTSPIELQFSPHLNTLIGGRGSGKSLILSALVRLFGVDRDWSTLEDGTIWEKRHLSLFATGGPFASPDVVLSAEYSKESGVRYRLTIEAPGEPLMEHRKLEMWSGGDWAKVAEAEAVLSTIDLHPLFFLQGQMSSMTGSGLDQHDLIRLIEGPVRALRQSLRNQLKDLTVVVRDGFQQKRQKVQSESRLKQADAQIKQKEAERKAFLDAAKKGLDKDQQALFEQAETYRKGKTSSQRLEDDLAEATTAVANVAADLERSLKAASEPIKNLQTLATGKFKDDPYLAGLLERAKGVLKDISALKQRGETDAVSLAKSKTAFLANIDALIGKANEFAEKERSRREAISKAAALEKEIGELNKQKAAAEQEIQKVERAGKIQLADTALHKFKEVVTDYSKQFKQRAEAISANPEFRLVVRVIPGGLYQDFLAAMKATCQGCGVREKTWGEFEHVLQTSTDTASKITELISSIISAYGEPEKAVLPAVWQECGFSEAVYKNILARTQMEDWLELSAVLADDKVDVRYKKGSGKPPIAILSASPGERAVELLKLALFSIKGPLVIDQPEDDLDNHFLAKQLVELVHQSKSTNQLLFASHNANLVVHGDAELIHVMGVTEVTEGKVGCGLDDSGTIDQQDICLAVERVMEGGRLAFEHRRRKYHETVDPQRVLKPDLE